MVRCEISMYGLFHMQIIHEYAPFTPSLNLRLYVMFIAPCIVIYRNTLYKTAVWHSCYLYDLQQGAVVR